MDKFHLRPRNIKSRAIVAIIVVGLIWALWFKSRNTIPITDSVPIPLTGLGQINEDGGFGSALEDLAARPELKTFVEIGTWNGQGSTRMIMKGLSLRKDIVKFWTFEADYQQAQAAATYWLSRTPPNVKMDVLYGRLATRMTPLEHVKLSIAFQPEMSAWWNEESKRFQNAPLLHSKLPASVDFVLLDGGEYTTLSDWEYVKTLNPKVVALDDTNTFKCKQIRSQLLAASGWCVVYDKPQERNGWTIFKQC